MEIKINTSQILNVLHIISWIILVGLCVETGGMIVNAFATLSLGVEGARPFWKQIDLSALYAFDSGHFFVQMFLMIIVSIMKTMLFYFIITLLYSKKIDLRRPFNPEMSRFIQRLSYLAVGIGLFSLSGFQYSLWLNAQGVKMPDSRLLNLDGYDVWLFMAVILFVIAQIFKRGIELQSENELTI